MVLQVEDFYQEEELYGGDRRITYVILSNKIDMSEIILTDKEKARESIQQGCSPSLSLSAYCSFGKACRSSVGSLPLRLHTLPRGEGSHSDDTGASSCSPWLFASWPSCSDVRTDLPF